MQDGTEESYTEHVTLFYYFFLRKEIVNGGIISLIITTRPSLSFSLKGYYVSNGKYNAMLFRCLNALD